MKKIFILFLYILICNFLYARENRNDVENRVYEYINSQAIDKEDIEDIYSAVIKSSKEFEVDPQF